MTTDLHMSRIEDWSHNVNAFKFPWVSGFVDVFNQILLILAVNFEELYNKNVLIARRSV